MLVQLSIDNYAIIDHLDILPDRHLNIVTGETGAGKSIILGALSLILGERADTSVLINKEIKCVVEARFAVADQDHFREALREADLDEEEYCIIRREISSAGKSRAFVNDTPVTLATLNKLTSLLVDLHQQFDTRSLGDETFQLEVVDALAGNAALKKEYSVLYRQLESLIRQLQDRKAEQSGWEKEAGYKQFLLEELDQVMFKEQEIEESEVLLKQLNAAERIIGVLQSVRYLLDEGEQPLSNELKRSVLQLQGITEVMPEAEALSSRIQSAYAEIKDVAAELEQLEQNVSLDPAQLVQLQERVDTGIRLLRKHGLQTTGELLQLQQQLEQELKASLDLHGEIAELERQQERLLQQVLKKGNELSDTRKSVTAGISARLTALLASVGMPAARIRIDCHTSDKPGSSGLDQVLFLLDANRSDNFQPLHKAASGGEMSRIALCIKSLIAQAVHLPTLIFDEVDTGISGEAARKVGALLNELARYHQVICITHQPQVAAKGSTHFYVYKEAGTDGRINTKLRTLPPDEKILAIARMIGGELPSEAAVNNARELIEN